MKTQKRLAAKVLKCSVKKVKFSQDDLSKVKECITTIDIKKLVSTGIIKKKGKNEQSRSGARAIREKKKKNQQRGLGSRKGKKTARLPRKELWRTKVRAQRAVLTELKDKLEPKMYRSLYRKSKGGFFRSKRHLKLYVEERGLMK